MFARSLLVLLFFLIAPTSWARPTAVCTITCAEKSTGVCAAPAYVHVDCTGTTDDDPAVRPFHDLHYAINYGDTGSSGAGNWTYSDKPRNLEKFPIGGHVYEQAGTFTIRGTVFDSDAYQWNHHSHAYRPAHYSADLNSITVVAEDTAWAAADTRCVSVAGDFTGCPAGAAQVTDATGDYDANLQTAVGKRTLYRCGETFVASVNPTLDDATANGSLIGGFGTGTTCATTPALVTWAYDGTLHASNAGVVLAGWRFRDISYQNTHVTGVSSHALGLVGGTVPNDKVLFLRTKTLDVAMCGGTVGMNAGEDTWNDLFANVDFECTNTKADGAGNPAWVLALASFKRGMLAGAKYDLRPVSSLGWRGMSFEKSLFAHNFWTGTDNDGTLTVHFRECAGTGNCATREDDYNVIAYNRFHDDSGETARNLVLNNFNATDATDQRKHDYIVEGNVFTYGPGIAARNPRAIEAAGVHRATIRNNLIDFRGLADHSGFTLHGIIVVNDGTLSPNPVAVDNYVYNNTVIGDQTASGAALNVVSLSQGTGHIARNNLGYEITRITGGSSCVGSAGICSNNALIYGTTSDCPFTGTDGACTLSATGASFDFDELGIRGSGGSRQLVVDQGFSFPDSPNKAQVYLDFAGNKRPFGGDGEFDLGASESQVEVPSPPSIPMAPQTVTVTPDGD